MIRDVYCSFEVAKLLKEKRFTSYFTNWYYVKEQFTHYNSVDHIHTPIEDIVPTCTHQMALAWLREHGIIITLILVHNHFEDEFENQWRFDIYEPKKGLELYDSYYNIDRYNTYEEAVEAALKYTLKNLI